MNPQTRSVATRPEPMPDSLTVPGQSISSVTGEPYDTARTCSFSLRNGIGNSRCKQPYELRSSYGSAEIVSLRLLTFRNKVCWADPSSHRVRPTYQCFSASY